MLDVVDRWAAYQVDAAVNLFGSVIDNAAQEMVNAGSGDAPKWKAKYTMRQLLDVKFRLPAPQTEREREKEATAQWQGMARTISVNPMLANKAE